MRRAGFTLIEVVVAIFIAAVMFAMVVPAIAQQFTVVPYSIPRRCAATYFPEANVLVPLHHFADKSHTPASKSVVISIRPNSAY